MKWKGTLIVIMCVTIAVVTAILGGRETSGKVRNYVNPGGIECLARNIYFEARNESLAGKLAVGHTTLNRVDSPYFPATICEVVYQGLLHKNGVPKRNKCQFSWWCDGQPDHIKNTKAWEESLELARYLTSQKDFIIDITEQALFYHATYVNPTWSKSFKKTARIDTHIFYR